MADRRDGKPLSETEGPLRMVVPDEKRQASRVSQVIMLTMATPVSLWKLTLSELMTFSNDTIMIPLLQATWCHEYLRVFVRGGGAEVGVDPWLDA